MKKTTILSILALVAITAGLFGINKVKAIVSSLTRLTSATATTTTTAYMTAGTATSTFNLYDLSMYSDDSIYDQNQLFLAFKASTSAATLAWEYQFSNNQVDWYEEDNVIAPTTLAGLPRFDHASTTVIHYWQPGSATASTSYKTVTVPDNAARYKRVLFSIPAGSTPGSIYVEVMNKQNPQ